MAGRQNKGPLKALTSPTRDYAVGYGKPPKHTRFQPGQSGNPHGRPKGSKNKHDLVGMERLKRIVLEEAYREVMVADGTGTVKVPVAQAVVRTMAVKAAKGDHRSQRLLSEMLWEIESDEREVNREIFVTAVQYKERCYEEIERRRRNGLPAPLILPHPDDVVVDWETGKVEIVGPVTSDQLEVWMCTWDEKEKWVLFRRDLEQRLATSRSPKQKAALRDVLRRVERKLRFINEILPNESYERWSARYPSAGALVEITIHR